MKEQIEKQAIEEMRKDLIEIFDEEYEKRRIITADFTAMKMANKGYRKQSEGEWIANRHISVSKRNRTIHYETYKCSVCGTWNGRHRPSFCPNCGAKMKGGAE